MTRWRSRTPWSARLARLPISYSNAATGLGSATTPSSSPAPMRSCQRWSCCANPITGRLLAPAGRVVQTSAMPDFLTTYADVQPDKLAVIDDRPSGRLDTMTFRELNEQANRLANVLLAHGVRKSTKVV